MAKDKKGGLIDVGDRVVLEGVVEKISGDENFATIAVVPLLPYQPPTKVTAKVQQLKIIEKFDSPE